MMILTLPVIYQLSRRYCPPRARWERLLRRGAPAWGPSHEIGHALLSQPHERDLEGYGLCAPAMCRCLEARCHIIELAAMFISAKLHLASDRRDLIATEIRATDSYDTIDTLWHWTRAAKLLSERKLTRVPRTVEGLERSLKRRLAPVPSKHSP